MTFSKWCAYNWNLISPSVQRFSSLKSSPLWFSGEEVWLWCNTHTRNATYKRVSLQNPQKKPDRFHYTPLMCLTDFRVSISLLCMNSLNELSFKHFLWRYVKNITRWERRPSSHQETPSLVHLVFFLLFVWFLMFSWCFGFFFPLLMLFIPLRPFLKVVSYWLIFSDLHK